MLTLVKSWIDYYENLMSGIRSTFIATDNAFQKGYEKVDPSSIYVDGVFKISNSEIGDSYRQFGRCLMVVDETVNSLHGLQIGDYFKHYRIDLTVFTIQIDKTVNTLKTFEKIVNAFVKFGLVSKEPVLIVGGRLTMDVVGFACSSYYRRTNYIRIPTSLSGSIDASIAIQVGENHGKLKNSLKAYHPDRPVILDFSFLKTLPIDRIRSGMVELIKIAIVGNKEIFKWLENDGEALLHSHFGWLDDTPELREVAHRLTYNAIQSMLALKDRHKLDFDRVIAYGHTWSPILELIPAMPMYHGHSVAIDMSFSATIAQLRGYITVADLDRIIGLIDRLGLAIDSPYLTPELLWKANKSKGLQSVAAPCPIGDCFIINDITRTELETALAVHHDICKDYPRNGDGKGMYILADNVEATPAGV
jgi:demethyl-4-deoxygadusol synthase